MRVGLIFMRMRQIQRGGLIRWGYQQNVYAAVEQ